MSRRKRDETIVQSTVDLGRNLGLKVVAEGVETCEALGRLRALGCHFAQGDFISPPVPADDIPRLVRESWAGAHVTEAGALRIA